MTASLKAPIQKAIDSTWRHRRPAVRGRGRADGGNHILTAVLQLANIATKSESRFQKDKVEPQRESKYANIDWVKELGERQHLQSLGRAFGLQTARLQRS